LLFNTLDFAVFLAVCLGAYVVLPHRWQNRLLLVASYVFYGAWNWRFLGLLALSTVVDWAIGMRLGREEDGVRRKRLVAFSVVVNLAILGAFKYANFFIDSFRELAGVIGLDVPELALRVVLPVGISFYTFQSLSYTIDVYRREIAPTRGLLDFALYVAFFPQLVAGPIERASRLMPQVLQPRRITADRFYSGCWLILWGTFKKVVIADHLATVVDAVYDPGVSPVGLEVVLGTYAFAFQILCDFSGYTDVARGTARLFGFELMLNFDLPYFATSPAAFWRRWHISLSSWLRDYLYVPLGGNRSGPGATYRNLALTMLLGGLWHGAAWTFVLWGAYQGALLIAHRLLQPRLARIEPKGAVGRGVWWTVRAVVMFQLVCLGWMIFRADSVGQLGTLLARIVTEPEVGLAGQWLVPFAVLVVPLLAMQAWQALSNDLEVVLRSPLLVRAPLYAAIFLAIVVLGEDHGEPFIYFQF